MNNDAFLIENSDIELAQSICKTIEDDTVRNRAVASVLAAKLSAKYFVETEIDTDSGLHNIAKIHNDIEVSDIYIRGNYIDVRVYFNENELCVPKYHFDNDTLPIAYMFIKLDEDLSSASVTGFMIPNAVNTDNDYNGYYRVTEDELVSYYDVESRIAEGTFDIDDDFVGQIFDYLNQSIADENLFFKTLFASADARKILKDAARTEYIFNFISKVKPIPTEATENTSPVATEEIENITEVEDNVLVESEATEELGFEESEADTDLLEPVSDFEPIMEESLDSDDGLAETALVEDEEIQMFDSTEETESLLEQNDEVEELSLMDADEDSDILEEQTSESIIEEDELPSFMNSDDDNLESFEPMEEIGLATDMPVEEIGFAEETPVQEVDSLEVQDEIAISEQKDLYTEPEEVAFAEPQMEVETDGNTETATEETDDSQLSDLSSISELLGDYEILEDNEETTVDSSESATEVVQDAVKPLDIVEEKQENEDFEYTTSTTPSINAYETPQDDERVSAVDLEESSLDSAENIEQTQTNSDHEIDTLFGEDVEETNADEQNLSNYNQSKGSKFLPTIAIIALLAGGAYYGYTKFVAPSGSDNIAMDEEMSAPIAKPVQNKVTPKEEAMPVETVEETKSIKNNEEGTSLSIPAIEQNLDASIRVSNLNVVWEVPAGYTTNNTAKRYLNKMGKIIQLNLKSEMLLLNKPPISNKILVELEYNKSAQRFDVKGITASSGEKSIDDLITNTVKNSLDINLNMNLNSFGNIQGNPTLVINL